MPGRLLSLVRPAPASSPPSESVKPAKAKKVQAEPLPIFPPVYSVEQPSNRSKSQESLVMEALKRHSMGRATEKKSAKADPPKAVTVNMVVESPPVVFYNTPEQSSGAIFSGQLQLDVHEPHVTLDKFEMRFLAITTTKKPVQSHCADCTRQETPVHQWDLVTAPVSLRHGVHSYPFSHLLPGHLPATTHGMLATLDYYLDAVATLSNGEKVAYKRNVDIKRAIFPGNEKNSIRIFPPTNLTAAVKLPPVVHPIGDFPIELRLSGITQNKADSQTRWRLRRLHWRIEETQTFVAPACAKHAQKVGGEGKGILHDETRLIANEEVKDCWKSDFSKGDIECEFRAACNVALKPLCDMQTSTGMSVKHNLIVELVVAEEWASLKKPDQATPTGAARVLRTQFHLQVTERSGMGISWDQERPPLYEDVPVSPPTYNKEVDLAVVDDAHATLL
jgi:hypothetical protein